MQRTIILGVEDIVTQRCGENFAIVPPDAADNLWIILDADAADELVHDIDHWRLGILRQEGESDAVDQR